VSATRDATSKPSTDELASLSREGLVALVLEQFEHIEELRGKIAALTHELQGLRRWRFGKRSEKLTAQTANAAQDQTPAGGAAPAPDPSPRKAPRRARPHGRNRLPEHLPRKPIRHEVPEADRICAGCHQPMTQIGEDVSEQLHVVPATACVLQHIRPKFACPRCRDHVVSAPLPPQAVDKCLASPALLAHVVTSKYADHLPLNRLVGILNRQGLNLTRSSLCGWVGATADALGPLYELLKKDVLASAYLQADDTTVPFLVPRLVHTKTGHLWVYRGDREHPHVVFEFSPDWKNGWPLRFLATYQGYLQADAYKGWDAVYARNPLVIEVGCMAHARRLWFEAKDTDPNRALRALSFIRQIYDLEDEAREMPPEGRKHLRQLKAAPVLATFRAWLDHLAGSLLPKSPLSQAWTYTHNQWSALVRYLEHGELEIDNNAAERALRPIALGRANWTFAGNEEGGRRAAILYSFVASSKRNGIDPLRYFTDVLERLPTHPKDDLVSLLPRWWKARPAEAANELAAAARGPSP
jgi:transposase